MLIFNIAQMLGKKARPNEPLACPSSMSVWLLFIANWPKFLGEQVAFQWDDEEVHFVLYKQLDY